ncbi:MAG: helix-turn-helix domain-containing protein [Spirochaetota bacterium]
MAPGTVINLYDRLRTRDLPVSAVHAVSSRDYPAHAHDYAELIIVTGGCALHRVGDAAEPLTRGSVCLIGTFVHSLSRVKGYARYNIAFSREMLASLGGDVWGIPGFHSFFLTGITAPRVLTEKQLAAADIVASRLVQECRSSVPGAQTLARAAFSELVVVLSRSFTASVKHAGRDAYAEISRIAWHLETNYRMPITLSALVDRSTLSLRHLMRMFRTLYGVSPIEYVLILRIRHAASLLRIAAKRITDVAFESGFSDSNYFSRQFKRAMGCTPREYRAQSIEHDRGRHSKI